MSVLAVGLMAGTSLDGVDAALVRVGDREIELVAFRTVPYSPGLRGRIEAVLDAGRTPEIADLHVALGEFFAGGVLEVLDLAQVVPSAVAYVASHGQTVWHQPRRVSLQLGSPSVIAERTTIPVISDFRSADVAAGGEGAPLVPMADAMLFGHRDQGRILLNIGGMANLTWVRRLAELETVMAFDTGPGMVLVDAVARATDPAKPYDLDGVRASHGKVVREVLRRVLADAYFDRKPPKSTGREYFGARAATRLLDAVRGSGGGDADALATAVAVTAQSVADQVARWLPEESANVDVVLSGGGAHNATLLDMLRRAVAPRAVVRFDDLFFSGAAKEAASFAYLGWRTVRSQPGSLAVVTGARSARVLGSITSAPGRAIGVFDGWGSAS